MMMKNVANNLASVKSVFYENPLYAYTYFYFVYNEKCMAQVYILEFWHVCDFLLQPVSMQHKKK